MGRASGGDASDAAPLRRAPAAEAAEAQLPGAGAAACGARPRSGRNGQVARREVRAAKNLCESRAAWIVKEKARGGLADGEIAEPMNVSVRRAHIPWARHRHAGPSARCAASHAHGTPVRVPARTQGSRRGGRAARAAQGRRGPPRGHIGRRTGIHIRRGPMRGILEACEAEKAEDFHRRRAWVRRECGHSNMMRHTDIVQLRPAGGPPRTRTTPEP